MAIADNHPERVAGLARMAATECGGDLVAAFAALADAAAALALAAGVSPGQAQDRLARNFRLAIKPAPDAGPAGYDAGGGRS